MHQTLKKGICWAHTVSACNGSMTREHVISKSILDRGWLRFDSPDIPPIGTNSFTVPILCQKHNNGLAQIDREAAHFFKGIRALHGDNFYRKHVEKMPDGQQIVRANGRLIEKWFAKTFINMVAQPLNYSRASKQLLVKHEHEIASLVFGTGSLPEMFGLWGPFGNSDGKMTMKAPLPSFVIELMRWDDIKVADRDGNIKHDGLVTPFGLNIKTGLFGFYGIFNLSVVSDDDFIAHAKQCHGTQFLSNPERCCRPKIFGFTHPDDAWKGSNPSRMIELSW